MFLMLELSLLKYELVTAPISWEVSGGSADMGNIPTGSSDGWKMRHCIPVALFRM